MTFLKRVVLWMCLRGKLRAQNASLNCKWSESEPIGRQSSFVEVPFVQRYTNICSHRKSHLNKKSLEKGVGLILMNLAWFGNTVFEIDVSS